MQEPCPNCSKNLIAAITTPQRICSTRYRIEQDQANWLIYVTDAGQANHFAQVFQVARRAGWIQMMLRSSMFPSVWCKAKVAEN